MFVNLFHGFRHNQSKSHSVARKGPGAGDDPLPQPPTHTQYDTDTNTTTSSTTITDNHTASATDLVSTERPATPLVFSEYLELL